MEYWRALVGCEVTVREFDSGAVAGWLGLNGRVLDVVGLVAVVAVWYVVARLPLG